MKKVDFEFGLNDDVSFIHENNIRAGKVIRVDIKLEYDEILIEYFVKDGELEIWLYDTQVFEDEAELFKSLKK